MNEVAWCYLEGYGCKKDKVSPNSNPPLPLFAPRHTQHAGKDLHVWLKPPLKRPKCCCPIVHALGSNLHGHAHTVTPTLRPVT